GPGLFSDPSVEIAVEVVPAQREAVLYGVATSATADAPATLPTQPRTTSPAAASAALPSSGLIVLADGYHDVRLRRPCDGVWTSYTYLIDSVTPEVVLMPPGGAYAPPLTLAVAANEPFVTRYA